MSKLNLQYVSNASPQSGVGHQATEIARRLKAGPEISLTEWHVDGVAGKLTKNGSNVATAHSWPGALGSKSVNWVRLGRTLASHESRLPAELAGVTPARRIGGSHEFKLWHFTNQALSFLAKRLQPSVVTVHDLIELLEPQDTKAYWLNRYLYNGIPAADHLICVSEYTKTVVQEHFSIAAEKITVIYNGVGPEFHPIPQFKTTVAYQTLRHELELPAQANVVLYVGSDHPRKNVVTAVQAFAAAQTQLDVPLVFLKVGAPGVSLGREALLLETEELGIRDSVRFIERVTTDRLNELYNMADVLVFPSRHEGFGLPPLQAMAAGTPVITSNATSLPEIVGEAGLRHEPDDVAALTEHLVSVLTDQKRAAELTHKGLQRAQQFSWEAAAQATRQVYQKVAGAYHS